jgi:hypothetical protein
MACASDMIDAAMRQPMFLSNSEADVWFCDLGCLPLPVIELG